MTFVACGVAIPPLGFAVQTGLVQGRDGPEVVKRHMSVDPLRLRARQAEKIDVDYEHSNAIVGEVAYLELGAAGELWAVATMRGPMPTPAKPVYWSVRARSNHWGDVDLERVAVTAEPAMMMARPLQFFDGELGEAQVGRWQAGDLERGVLTRAAATRARRGAIIVRDVDAARAEQRERREEAEMMFLRSGPAELHYRGGGSILSVR